MELREARKTDGLFKIEKLGYWNDNEVEARKTLEIVNAIELGRVVTRDIGGSDPERMSAPKVADYVTELFKSTEVKVRIIEGQETFEKEYPCLAAVNRAANCKILKIKYKIIV